MFTAPGPSVDDADAGRALDLAGHVGHERRRRFVAGQQELDARRGVRRP